MKRVLEHIHAHISDSIEVEQLASVACVTKPYFIKLFKREFGFSPVQYINKKKVERGTTAALHHRQGGERSGLHPGLQRRELLHPSVPQAYGHHSTGIPPKAAPVEKTPPKDGIPKVGR